MEGCVWLCLKFVSLSEQCSSEARPVEKRRAGPPVRSEESKGEVVGAFVVVFVCLFFEKGLLCVVLEIIL
jgi:hypothetical protein